MNTVQRFFRRYIFFMTGTMMLFLPPTAHRFRWSAKKMAAVCVRFWMTGWRSPGISESVESGG